MPIKHLLLVAGGQPTSLKNLLINRYAHIPMEQWLFVGIDGGCLHLLNEELPLDLAIGDFDSLTTEQYQRVKTKAVTVQQFPSKKDNTDTEEALLWCMQHYPEAMYHVVGAFGGRIDHEWSNLWLFFQPRFSSIRHQLHLENETNSFTCLEPGQYTIEKMQHTHYLSFISLTAVENLTLTNVEYPLKNAHYEYPIALISNEFLEEKMTISFTKGLIVVGQCCD